MKDQEIILINFFISFILIVIFYRKVLRKIQFLKNSIEKVLKSFSDSIMRLAQVTIHRTNVNKNSIRSLQRNVNNLNEIAIINEEE